MYERERLVVLDADGTTIDAFDAIGRTFKAHGMDIGDLDRFQKRHKLFKYLGGLKEFPANLKKQIGKRRRKELIATLTEIYREEARLYPGIGAMIQQLQGQDDVRIGLVTRNITEEPKATLTSLFRRHELDLDSLDFFVQIPLSDTKTKSFRKLRHALRINPALSYVCGDEHGDYLAAVGAGMHPFMVSYGFDDHERLTAKKKVPEETISRTPEELQVRLFHALGIKTIKNND